MAKVQVKEIHQKVITILENAGLSKHDAERMAAVLTDTQMKGIYTHGYFRLKRYVDCIKCGGIKPQGDLKIVQDSPSWAVVDGQGGLGMLIAENAMDLAIQKAKETGIGIVNVSHSHHLGPTGYYAAKCADAKMIGFSMSNAGSMMAATGSAQANMGNNPFSYAVPAGKYDKILYDVAISMSSDIKILQMEKEGKQLPPGWIIDSQGRPTTDPSEYLKGGVLLPFGGYKGYGLALMVEMFAGVLSGAGYGKEVLAWNTNPEKDGNVGHFFMAIDISKMMDADLYEKKVEGIIDEIKASKLAEGATGIYYPGEMEKARVEACLASGEIFVDDDVLAQVEELLQ